MASRTLDGVPARGGGRHRRVVRYATAAVAALTAAVYLAIAFDLVQVVDPATSEPGGLLGFGLLAAAAFALGSALLLAGDWRPVWLVGAGFQLFAIVMYVAVSTERAPPYEPWGLALRIPQLLMLAALAYLFVQRPSTA